jgi:hypothetical protein
MPEIVTNQFSGGINNVIESHLLPPNFAKNLENCRIQNGAIKSNYKPIVKSDDLDETLIYQDGKRSLVKFGGVFYWSDNETGELNSSLGYLGIPTPVKLATVSDGAAGGRFASGDNYKYFYTYRTAEGFRSAPASITEFSEYTVNKDLGTLILSDIDETIDPIVSHVEFWRTLPSGSVFYKSGEVERWTTLGSIVYEDKTDNLTLQLNEQYDLSSPAGKPDEGRYLTERNSVFYIAVNDRLYFSEQSNPHAYDQLNFITFDDTIRGSISTEDYTLVLTRNRAYRVLGDSIVDIRKEEIPDAQGILNWQTLSRVKNTPVWVSNDGLCGYQPYDNRSGRKITVFTHNLFNLPKNPLFAEVANDVYYLMYGSEVIAFDFVDNLKVYKLDWKFDWAWYDKDADILIGSKDSVFFDAQGGEELEWEYLTPEFVADDMQRLKQFGRISVDSDNDLQMVFYSDGDKVWDTVIEGSGHRREFVNPVVEGRRIQVRVRSKGDLRGISYEYITRRL